MTLLKQLYRYTLTAGVGFAVDFGVLIFSKEVLNAPYLLAATFGFISGVVVLYLLGNRYVFSNPKIKSELVNFLIFTIIGVIGLGILLGLMKLLTGVLGIQYVLSKLLATVVVYLWNFFARRLLYRSA